MEPSGIIKLSRPKGGLDTPEGIAWLKKYHPEDFDPKELERTAAYIRESNIRRKTRRGAITGAGIGGGLGAFATLPLKTKSLIPGTIAGFLGGGIGGALLGREIAKRQNLEKGAAMTAKDIIKLATGTAAKRVITASNEVTSQRQKPAMARHAKGIIRQTPRMGYAKWTKGGGSQVIKKELKRKFRL